jgi:hypothetical protein
MIEYFENNIKQMSALGADKYKIKYTIFSGGYYHKFIAGYDIHDFLARGDVHQLVKAINRQCNGLIADYQIWPEFGGVYLKCHKVDFVYYINSAELIEKFDSLEIYLEYALKKIIDFSRDIYPCHFNDWLKHNVAVQADLSWVVVDLDDMLEYRPHLIKRDVIDLLIYKLAREGGHIDTEKAKAYITKYFKDNPDALDFIKE